MISRRQLLKVGAASMVVTGAGLGMFAVSRTPDKALAPWGTDAHNYSDPRLKALSYAILSPNPHNRQPWLAELVGDNEILLTCDLARRLPHTDPFDRQITIGLGCFLETLAIAAAEESYDTVIEYFPDGEPIERLDDRPVAKISMRRSSTIARDPLFGFIKQRRSNKQPYDTSRPVELNATGKLLASGKNETAVSIIQEQSVVEKFRDLTWRAHEVETYTPRTLQESIDLMRIGKSEINANPDGIDLGGFQMEMIANLGMLDRAQMADPKSAAFKQGLDMYYEIMQSAMGYAVIVTQDNSRQSQLNAGRTWMRLNLTATQHGVAIHPISQALQEYPEMAAIYDEFHRELNVNSPARVQMFGRIGYGPETGPSPRWEMEKSLIKTA